MIKIVNKKEYNRQITTQQDIIGKQVQEIMRQQDQIRVLKYRTTMAEITNILVLGVIVILMVRISRYIF